VLNIIINKYKNKIRIKQLRKLKFKTFKEVISLKAFKERYIKDFYSNKELRKLKKFFNMDQMTLDAALMKRSILNKIVVRKYNSLFYLKELPNRFLKRKRKYFKRKKRKKNLNLRVKFFYRITYDTFLFYLNLSNKQLIIKPFNFLNCLFFYKSKTFRKAYVIRKRRRMRFRFYYKFRRRKKRRSIRRRRIRFLKYKFKGKSLMKRLKQIKIRKYKNFLRFVSFFNACKKVTLQIDDYFKINSILNLPYKLLKLNFNKITNSYNYFLNFNSQRKKRLKINTTITKNIFNKEKTKLYNIIKCKLQNRFLLNYKSNIENVNNNTLNFNSLLKTNNKNIINQFPDYLFYNNIIKNKIIDDYQINNFKRSNNINKLMLFIKLINNITKKILFFEKKIISFKNKRKKQLSYLFLKLFKINKKIINKFRKYKKILNILLDITIKLKNKLKELIITFYILFSNLNNLTLTNNLKFLKKIFFFLKRKKKKMKTRSNLKKRNKLLLSFLFCKSKFIFFKNRKFIFSYKNKLNNFSGKPWKRRKLKKKRNRRRKHAFLKYIKKNFSLSNFFLYKNYFSKKNLLKNNNYYYFGNKKFKCLYLNFLKKSNLSNLKNPQKIKNINFLN
jgi:hypothetical protein